MSTKSKAWDWDKAVRKAWMVPSRESWWLIERWREQGKKDFLDLGVGMGRHAVQFAKAGFAVAGLDLSKEAVEKTKEWAKAEYTYRNEYGMVQSGWHFYVLGRKK